MGSNHRPTAYKAAALTAELRLRMGRMLLTCGRFVRMAMCMSPRRTWAGADAAGVEPANTGVKVPCLAVWLRIHVEPGAGLEPTSLLWPLSYPGEWQRPERRPPPLTHPQKTICPTTNTWVLRAGLVLPQPAASVANCSAHGAGLSRLPILFESFDGVVKQESKCGSPGQASGVAPDPGNRPLPGSLTACR